MSIRLLRLFKIFTKWIAIMSGAISTYDAVITQFISPIHRDRYLISVFGWSWQTWLVAALLLLVLLFVINMLFPDKTKDSSQEKEKTESITATASGGGNALAFRDNYGIINQGHQQAKQAALFTITPNITRNEKWVSIVIPNPVNNTIECYAIWKTIERNGKVDDEIKKEITAHSNRVSWSGGDTKGKEEGVKCIDPYNDGILNVVTPTHSGLRFETASGPRDLGRDMQYGAGAHRIILDLRYRSIGGGDFQSKIQEVNFDCYIELAKSTQELMDEGSNVGYPCGEDPRYPDVIKTQFGVASFTDFLIVRECMCVKIIR